jgi:hypothetical protein
MGLYLSPKPARSAQTGLAFSPSGFLSEPSTASVIEKGSGSGRSIDDDRQDHQEVQEVVGRRDLAEHHVGLFRRRAAAENSAAMVGIRPNQKNLRNSGR